MDPIQPAPPVSRRAFVGRLLRHMATAALLLGFALGLGVLGYHFIAHMGWIDSLLNASMILGGMGPVDPLPNNASKIFASIYALFSGLVFIGVAGVILVPVAHHVLHMFHWESRSR